MLGVTSFLLRKASKYKEKIYPTDFRRLPENLTHLPLVLTDVERLLGMKDTPLSGDPRWGRACFHLHLHTPEDLEG